MGTHDSNSVGALDDCISRNKSCGPNIGCVGVQALQVYCVGSPTYDTEAANQGGCMKKCGVCKGLGLLVVVGAINWGLVGILQFDLVAKLLGPMSTGSRVVYGLIGIAGLLKLVSCFKGCPKCCGSQPSGGQKASCC